MVTFDKRLIQRLRVPLGFVFAIVFFIFARPTLVTLVAGGAVALIGLAIRAWASGHIRKASELATSGPYAYTRNPLYLGTLFLGVGFTVATGVWWLAVAFTALYIGIYLPVMRVETEDIRRIFGSDFDEYERNVPLLMPRLRRWKKSGANFDYHLYLRYREYQAALGCVAALTILAAKAYFLR
jgi:protein-S-isoprenylcysteine O-methyltransferase Ste14